jgi:hypothetical protein
MTDSDTKPARGRPAQDLRQRVLKYVEITNPHGCWHWIGACNPPYRKGGGLYCYPQTYTLQDGSTRQCSSLRPVIPRPYIKLNGKKIHPVRALKRVPEGVQLRRKTRCPDQLCVNPYHWSYPNESVMDPPLTGDPVLDEACKRYAVVGWSLDDIQAHYGNIASSEFIDRIKENCL